MMKWMSLAVLVFMGAAGFVHLLKQMERRNQEHGADVKMEKHDTRTFLYEAQNLHGLPDNRYSFRIEWAADEWRAYVVQMPDLGRRDSSLYITHRMMDGDRTYICWNQPIKELATMQTICKVWADFMQEYAATGRRF